MFEVIKFIYDVGLGWLPEEVRPYAFVGIAIVFGVVTLVKSLKFVPQDHIGMRTRFNKVILRYKPRDDISINRQMEVDQERLDKNQAAKYGRPKWIKPGWQVLMPWVHDIVVVNTLEKTIKIGKQIRLADDVLYEGVVLENISMAVRVGDPYLWRYACDSAQERLISVGDTLLGPIIDSHSKEEVIKNAPTIQAQFLADIKHLAEEVGGEVMQLFLGTKTPMAAEGWVAQAIASVSKNLGLMFGIQQPSAKILRLLNELNDKDDQSSTLAS